MRDVRPGPDPRHAREQGLDVAVGALERRHVARDPVGGDARAGAGQVLEQRRLQLHVIVELQLPVVGHLADLPQQRHAFGAVGARGDLVAARELVQRLLILGGVRRRQPARRRRPAQRRRRAPPAMRSRARGRASRAAPRAGSGAARSRAPSTPPAAAAAPASRSGRRAGGGRRGPRSAPARRSPARAGAARRTSARRRTRRSRCPCSGPCRSRRSRPGSRPRPTGRARPARCARAATARRARSRRRRGGRAAVRPARTRAPPRRRPPRCAAAARPAPGCRAPLSVENRGCPSMVADGTSRCSSGRTVSAPSSRVSRAPRACRMRSVKTWPRSGWLASWISSTATRSTGRAALPVDRRAASPRRCRPSSAVARGRASPRR